MTLERRCLGLDLMEQICTTIWRNKAAAPPWRVGRVPTWRSLGCAQLCLRPACCWISSLSRRRGRALLSSTQFCQFQSGWGLPAVGEWMGCDTFWYWLHSTSYRLDFEESSACAFWKQEHAPSVNCRIQTLWMLSWHSPHCWAISGHVAAVMWGCDKSGIPKSLVCLSDIIWHNHFGCCRGRVLPSSCKHICLEWHHRQYLESCTF